MTVLACVSVPGCRVPLGVLEALSVGREELAGVLADLRVRTGAGQVCVVSTCERVEVYAAWDGPEPGRVGTAGPESLLEALVAGLAANRAVPGEVVARHVDRFTGRDASRHLLRVCAGLESFVLGERDIVGQVRCAADASRTAGTGGLELERLLATAVNTSRRVHRSIPFGAGGRSVAAAAVRLAAAEHGGDLTGRRVLVVGAGQVAAEVAAHAARLGAAVTVCNRTKRHADRFAAVGARVVDLARLPEVLAEVDLAIFGTAAPHRLLDATQAARATRANRGAGGRELWVVDLCVPRNVDPAVRSVPGLRLLDLDDLRATGADTTGADTLTSEVGDADRIVTEELDRYHRWLSGRAATASLRRLRADVDAYAEAQAHQATRGVPAELHPLIEDRVRRAVRRLAHAPTRRLLQAADAGDHELVEVLAGMFAPASQTGAPAGPGASAPRPVPASR